MQLNGSTAQRSKALWFFAFLHLCLISAGARLTASTQTTFVHNPDEKNTLW